MPHSLSDEPSVALSRSAVILPDARPATPFSDRIHIEQLKIFADIGVPDKERSAPHRLTISISFWPYHEQHCAGSVYYSDDALLDSVDQHALYRVDVLDHPRHQIASGAIVEPAQGQRLNVRIEITAQIEDHFLLKRVVQNDP